MLIRVFHESTNKPYVWSYINQPGGTYSISWAACSQPYVRRALRHRADACADGAVFVLFVNAHSMTFPNDGLHFLEKDQRYSIPVQQFEVRESLRALRLPPRYRRRRP
jgi:hypothetical protein